MSLEVGPYPYRISMPHSENIRAPRSVSRTRPKAVDISAYLGVASLTFSAYDVPAGALLLLALCFALHATSGVASIRISNMHLVTVSFFGLYFALGVLLGGYRLGISSLVSELRWLPAVAYSLAVSVLDKRYRVSYLLSCRDAVVVASATCLASAVIVPFGLRDPWELWGFTSSHHIPGLLSGGGLILVWVLPHKSRTVRFTSVAFLLLALLLSQSRTALLAIGIVVLVQALKAAYRELDLKWISVCVLIFLLVLAVSSRTRETVVWLATPGELSSISSANGSHGSNSDLTSSQANVSNRFVLYHESLKATREYWIVGVGPGHLNDYFENSSRLVSGPLPPPSSQFHRVETETTAHNFWLHVSAETGLLGGGLLIAVTWTFLFAPSSSYVSRYLMLLGLTSGGLLTIAAVVPWLGVALLMQGWKPSQSSGRGFVGGLVR